MQIYTGCSKNCAHLNGCIFFIYELGCWKKCHLEENHLLVICINGFLEILFLEQQCIGLSYSNTVRYSLLMALPDLLVFRIRCVAVSIYFFRKRFNVTLVRRQSFIILKWILVNLRDSVMKNWQTTTFIWTLCSVSRFPRWHSTFYLKKGHCGQVLCNQIPWNS